MTRVRIYLHVCPACRLPFVARVAHGFGHCAAGARAIAKRLAVQQKASVRP